MRLPIQPVSIPTLEEFLQLPEVKDKQDILPVLNILQNWQLTVEDVFSWLSFGY